MANPERTRANLERWIEPIAKGPLLGGLDEEAILNLLELAELDRIVAGHTLMVQGDVGRDAYLILEGQLDVIVETPLGEVVVATVGPQEMVGEIAVFSQLPRTATVRASTDAAVLRLSGEHIGKVIASHPKSALGLLEALGRRVAALNRPLAMLTLAAQALERADLDLPAMAALFNGAQDAGPFAQSFRKLLLEMERKQSRQQEMVVAARLQQSILPRALDFAGRSAPFAVEAMMRPAREIGGDFYDFFFTEDSARAVLVVADVSGKGIPAALFMAVSRTVLRAAVMAAPSIDIALTRANAHLEAENPECLFVTVFMAELNLATGMINYVNAGHCDGYLVNPNGTVNLLAATSPAVALLPRPRFVLESVALSPGDLLLLISDGVTEAFRDNGDLFGEDRLYALAGDLGRGTAAQALAAVDQAVLAFVDGFEQSDDVTCLALSYLPGN